MLPSRPDILDAMSARSIPGQVPLPLEPLPEPPAAQKRTAEEPEDDRPRRGRPRVWASEAERKRAYRERLAADYAEPERLRRELRAERKRVAEGERRLARKDGDLMRARSEIANQVAHRTELEAIVDQLNARIDYWKKQAGRLGERLVEERNAPSSKLRQLRNLLPRGLASVASYDFRHPPSALTPHSGVDPTSHLPPGPTGAWGPATTTAQRLRGPPKAPCSRLRDPEPNDASVRGRVGARGDKIPVRLNDSSHL